MLDQLLEFWRPVSAERLDIHPDDATIVLETPHRLPSDRAPEPWFGDPVRARVFTLTLNPGHKPEGSSTGATWRAFCFDMIDRKVDYLRYQTEAPPDAIAWAHNNMGDFLPHALDEICNLRLLAYPSENKAAVNQLIKRCTELASSRLMLSFVHDHLVPRAKTGEILLLVMRSTEDWGFGRCDFDRWTGGLFVSKFGMRNASISPTSRVGKRISAFLGV